MSTLEKAVRAFELANKNLPEPNLEDPKYVISLMYLRDAATFIIRRYFSAAVDMAKYSLLYSVGVDHPDYEEIDS